jgi:hypothetical protein
MHACVQYPMHACCGLYRAWCMWWTWCVRGFSMPVYASNVNMCIQYYQRTPFSVLWMHPHTQEPHMPAVVCTQPGACTVCKVCTVAHYVYTCIKCASGHTIFSESPILCVIDAPTRTEAPHMPSVICTQPGACTKRKVCVGAHYTYACIKYASMHTIF